MASSAKDIQLRELKDTVSQLKTMVSEQTELIRSLRLMIDEKSSHEKALQEQVDYLTKKLFGSSSERRSDDIPGQQNLFDEAEMEQALKIGAKIIGINNRDLKDFTIHLDTTKRLSKMVDKEVVLVSESGVTKTEDIIFLKECSVDALLIGRAFMEAGNPEELAREWKKVYQE